MNLNYEMLYCFLIILSGTFEAESPAPKGNLGKSVLDEKIFKEKSINFFTLSEKVIIL
jgi:hypothetical protein